MPNSNTIPIPALPVLETPRVFSYPCGTLSTMGTKQLYNTVAVPRFSYGAEVWYTYLHKPGATGKTRGSVAITNKL